MEALLLDTMLIAHTYRIVVVLISELKEKRHNTIFARSADVRATSENLKKKLNEAL